MLKKAGIIVAVAATGVLAVSSLAFADEEKGNLSNDCAFENVGGNPEASASNSSLVTLVTDIVVGAAASVTSQTNTLNCNNVQLKDLIDQGSNNKTKNSTETRTEDSFNTEG